MSRAVVILHGLAAALTMVMGVLYISRTDMLPYHLEALSTTWDAIEPAYQALFLAFYRGVGAGYLTSGLAVMILVLLPLRQGAAWSRWAIPLIICAAMGPLTWVILTVRANTPAEPPLVFPLVVMGLTLVAGALSLKAPPGPRAD